MGASASVKFRGAQGGGRHARGFTIVELVVVLLLVAVLAAVAMPRLFSDELRVAPVADRMAAEIRYAQALAMTRGEAHQFRVSGGAFFITRTDSGCGDSGAQVPLSDGEPSASFPGLTVSGSSCVSFSSLFGAPDGAHSFQVSGGGNSATVQVTAETGYALVQT